MRPAARGAACRLSVSLIVQLRGSSVRRFRWRVMMSESIKSAVKAALKSASALTTATALLGFATAVSAQEAAPAAAGSSEAETVDEVVVTGFRASLNAALSDKR